MFYYEPLESRTDIVNTQTGLLMFLALPRRACVARSGFVIAEERRNHRSEEHCCSTGVWALGNILALQFEKATRQT
jgi:hypothetical protein